MSLVLVIDDSATLLMSLSRILQKAGYEVASAADGREGLDMLEGGLHPCVILTDLHMPHVDGITFIKEVRRHRATRFIPIIGLTADDTPRKRDEARLAGASGWLVKPVLPEELLATLKLALATPV